MYILTNKNNTVLYVGVTSNLFARITEHKAMEMDGFTKRYIITKLVYYEYFDFIEEAISREKQLKGKSRSFKLALINTMNPDFKDLFNDILEY